MLRRRRYRKVAIHDDGEACVIDFGGATSSFRVPRLGQNHRAHADFVLWILAAVGMTRGWRFELEAPVTREAALHLDQFLFVWSCWQARKIRPTEIVPVNIVEPDRLERRGGVVTLSGGVDSTFAVLKAKLHHGLEHAILVAGADYPSADHPGFRELKARVNRMTDDLGINLHVAETNIREIIKNWDTHHIAILTSILRLAGSGLAWGGYAADVTEWGELTYAPGSNMNGFAKIAGTSEFHFRYFGSSESRDMKISEIAKIEPNLLKEISVCWIDTSTGGNCGRCSKCVRTRLALFAAGLPQTAIFEDELDLVRAVENLPFPLRRSSGIQQIRLNFYYLERMPEGPVRDALEKKMHKMARRYGVYEGPHFSLSNH